MQSYGYDELVVELVASQAVSLISKLLSEWIKCCSWISSHGSDGRQSRRLCLILSDGDLQYLIETKQAVWNDDEAILFNFNKQYLIGHIFILKHDKIIHP
jgi:hypothetical protein